MTAKLIDVSHHQDWPHDNLLRTLDGIILRCAYSVDQPDTKFATFAAFAKARGLPWAAYHFIKPGDGAKQAEFAMRRLDAVGGCPVLFMDREYERGVIASEATAHAYIDRVRQAGLITGTYASLSIYQSFGADIDWPAFWGSAPPPVWHVGDFWQYAGDDVPKGNHIDRDYFNGTPAELKALFAGATPGQPHTPPVVPVPPVGQGKGDVMYNLAPGSADTQKQLKEGAILYDRAVGGTRYSRVPADMWFPFLGGANADRVVVADGDYAVFANRADLIGSKNVPARYGK